MDGLRLFCLVALVMTAFAANSILNRSAVGAGEIDALAFALYRLVSGALALAILVALRDRRLPLPRFEPNGIWSLALYMIGFSIAYVSLDAGLGALILFGGVQLTMFAGAVLAGERIAPGRWAGAAVAFGGLVYLLNPGPQAPSFIHAVAMIAAVY